MKSIKKLIALAIVVFTALSAGAQLNPVTWSFSSKKISDKTYEIHMKATIQNSWHLYSQKQPDEDIPFPTTFTINANPIFKLEGKILEVGKMEVINEALLGVTVNQYSKTVDFVQKIKLKANVKTNFNGSVEYQTCDDKKCLAPKTVNFSVAIK